MLLESDYRHRAIGLVAAFAVLITGAIFTGAITPTSVKAIDAKSRSSPSFDRLEVKRANDCGCALQCGCGTVC